MMTSQSTGKETMPPLPLPYRFANEHGVLCTNGRVYYRATTSLLALQEVQRTVAPILKVEQLDDDTFAQRQFCTKTLLRKLNFFFILIFL